VNLIPVSLCLTRLFSAPTATSTCLDSPLSPFITPPLFHSRLKTYLFHNFSPTTDSLPPCRNDSTDFMMGPFLLIISVFGRPFVKRFALCYRSWTVVLSLWPNGWMDQDETWHAGRPRPRPHCIRWGPSSPHGKGHRSPNLSKFTGAGYLRPYNPRPMSTVTKRLDRSRCHLVEGRPQPRPHCARWGPSSPPPKKRHSSPQFSAHVCCG